MLKLEYIYLSVGIITMLLNLATTIHFIGRGRSAETTGSSSYDEIITFRLSGDGRSVVGNQARESLDETETIQ
ncbi:MAG TPA: hypothetical protein VN549_06050 [Negativicutes bacterium]|nr:hypothetical protein [Negativicutes bacterium]